MKKKGLLLLAIACFIQVVTAQTRFLIRFKDKASSPYSLTNPLAYLSQRAIDRRTRYGIAIDSADLPVTPGYLDSIRSVANVSILNVSKWLNQVSIQTTDPNAIQTINRFSFVRSVAPIAARVSQQSVEKPDKYLPYSQQSSHLRQKGVIADYYNYGHSFSQIHIHNGEFLHNIGLRGQNMIIGMLDAGFYHYTSLKAFDSMNANGQVLGTWDFVHGEPSVMEDDTHGMECLSAIAANIPNTFVGTAPKADFYLFVTEDTSSEYPIEEHNWVCGAERVDSAGGDVISSSLGYNTFDNAAYNHTYADMNGHTTIAAKGAAIAVRKGILVVNAAGNEGNNNWHYIITPADGDSVLAVGAVNASGQVAAFSSYGPSSSGQVKPDVASVGAGTVIQYPNNTIGGGNGTSFACPNMAGLATCLWQGFPEFNNMKIVNALRQSGSIANAPDNRIGYGIPDVKKALVSLLQKYATSTATLDNCVTTLSWTSKDMSAMRYEIERKAPGEITYTKIADMQGSGGVFARHTYQFTDSLRALNARTVFYRVRQIADTATATFTAFYIDSSSVVSNGGCYNTGTSIVTVIPNPARSSFTLVINTPDAIPALQVRITNAIGQIVQRFHFVKPAGAAAFPISLANMASGKYFVSLYDNSKLIETATLLKL